MARYYDPDANAQNGERFAEQSMLNTPLPRLSTDSIGGLSSPTVNWNHTRLRLQNLVFCGANACSDRKVMQLAGLRSPCPQVYLRPARDPSAPPPFEASALSPFSRPIAALRAASKSPGSVNMYCNIISVKAEISLACASVNTSS